MSIQRISLPFSPRQQAAAMATSVALTVYLGMAAALAIAIAVLWLLAQFLLLALMAIVECANAIGTTYQTADPMVKFLLLVVIGYAIYRAARAALRKRVHQ